MENLIEVKGVSKKLCKSMRKGMKYGLQDVGRALFGLGPNIGTDLRPGEFWALKDINFRVKSHSIVGVVGNNGSGKSTLLRLINGIYPLTKGEIVVNGKIAPLIAVGAGFHPHMTGRENVFLKGAILGIPRAEIKNRFDEIVNFAEIGDFIDSPISTFSSGMKVRLGFAIAVHCPIQILLADEILAVGDQAFRIKCLAKIRELKASGVATLIVSHNHHHIAENCDEVLVIDHGEQKYFGDVKEGLEFYYDKFANDEKTKFSFHVNTIEGSGVSLLKAEFTPAMIDKKIVAPNNQIKVKIFFKVSKKLTGVHCGLRLRLPSKGMAFSENTSLLAYPNHVLEEGEHCITLDVPKLPFNGETVLLYIRLWSDSSKEPMLELMSIPVLLPRDESVDGWGRFNSSFAFSRTSVDP